jgi:general secretion pathway protein I
MQRRLRKSGNRHTAGFTLIEVLVALSIVGLLTAAIFTVFGIGGRGHQMAGDVDEALAVVDTQLDAAGVADALRAGATEGIFADRFRWQVVVAPYEDKDRLGGTAEPIASPLRLFRIEATVSWQEGGRARHISLATLRLGPAPP